MIDIRQSPVYAQFLKEIGWQVEKINPPSASRRRRQVFIKKFPLIGSFIKIQRINPPIPFSEIEKLAQKYRAFQIIIEPNKVDKDFKKYGYRRGKSPFSPSKTIQIDLKKDEEEIFKNFTTEKKRAIKKAKKNKVIVKSSKKIDQFIKLKDEKMGTAKILLGRSQAKQIKSLWQTFKPENATLLAAFSEGKMVAGILLLFYDKVAYYWLAGSTKRGNKLGAPSLLTWEALKLAKEKGCKLFDFEGIKDPRYKSTSSWAGFTRFKKGFGGKEIEFPGVFVKYRLPL